MRIRGYAPGTPCWADVSSAGPEVSQDFYADLFGWEPRASDGYTLFRLAGRTVAGLGPVGAPGDVPAWLMYITTADVELTAKAVDAAGGRVLLSPVGMGEAGRTALFADPAGAVFAAWQPGIFRGAEVFNEPGALCWYGLTTPDPAGARAFYREVFGWSDERDRSVPDGYEWLNGGDAVAGVLPGDTAAWTAYVMVRDCVDTLTRAVELGGSRDGAPVDTALCRYAHVVDPGGARFAVMELAPEVRRALLL